MYALTAERGLKAQDFEDIKTFLVTLWRPSAITAHDTAHDTGQDTGQVTVQVVHLNYLSEPQRVVLILEGEMSRDGLMTPPSRKIHTVDWISMKTKTAFPELSPIRPSNPIPTEAMMYTKTKMESLLSHRLL